MDTALLRVFDADGLSAMLPNPNEIKVSKAYTRRRHRLPAPFPATEADPQGCARRLFWGAGSCPTNPFAGTALRACMCAAYRRQSGLAAQIYCIREPYTDSFQRPVCMPRPAAGPERRHNGAESPLNVQPAGGSVQENGPAGGSGLRACAGGGSLGDSRSSSRYAPPCPCQAFEPCGHA